MILVQSVRLPGGYALTLVPPASWFSSAMTTSAWLQARTRYILAPAPASKLRVREPSSADVCDSLL
jgi:hypothetical protein